MRIQKSWLQGPRFGERIQQNDTTHDYNKLRLDGSELHCLISREILKPGIRPHAVRRTYQLHQSISDGQRQLLPQHGVDKLKNSDIGRDGKGQGGHCNDRIPGMAVNMTWQVVARAGPRQTGLAEIDTVAVWSMTWVWKQPLIKVLRLNIQILV